MSYRDKRMPKKIHHVTTHPPPIFNKIPSEVLWVCILSMKFCAKFWHWVRRDPSDTDKILVWVTWEYRLICENDIFIHII